MGCPSPPYIKEPGGRRRPAKEGAPRGESYSHPSFLVGVGEGGKEEEEGKERGGAAPLPLSYSD